MDETEIFGPPDELFTGSSGTSGVSLSDAASGVGSWLTDLAKIAGTVEVARIKSNTPTYFRAPNGQIVREGQAGQVVGATGMSPLLLILIAGAVLLVALKD